MARMFQNPFSADSRLDACGCGRDHAAGLACDPAPMPADGTGALGEAAEVAVMKAVFPEDSTRRAMLRLFGAGTVMAAIETFLEAPRT